MDRARNRSVGANILILVSLTVLNSLLARYALYAGPVAPGVAAVYISVAFMISSTLWFGAWGAAAAYLGCFFGAGILSGMPVDVSLYWSLADLWQVAIPLLAFKRMNADVNLVTKRDLLVFFVFGCVLNNLVGASWGSTTLALARLIQWNEVLSTLVSWFASNLMVTVIFASLLLRFVTPYVRSR